MNPTYSISFYRADLHADRREALDCGELRTISGIKGRAELDQVAWAMLRIAELFDPLAGCGIVRCIVRGDGAVQSPCFLEEVGGDTPPQQQAIVQRGSVELEQLPPRKRLTLRRMTGEQVVESCQIAMAGTLPKPKMGTVRIRAWDQVKAGGLVDALQKGVLLYDMQTPDRAAAVEALTRLPRLLGMRVVAPTHPPLCVLTIDGAETVELTAQQAIAEIEGIGFDSQGELQVRCDSGAMGSRGCLRGRYKSYEEFDACCHAYNIHGRLGFVTPTDAWDADPVIQSSTNPADLRVVSLTELTES